MRGNVWCGGEVAGRCPRGCPLGIARAHAPLVCVVTAVLDPYGVAPAADRRHVLGPELAERPQHAVERDAGGRADEEGRGERRHLCVRALLAELVSLSLVRACLALRFASLRVGGLSASLLASLLAPRRTSSSSTQPLRTPSTMSMAHISKKLSQIWPI